MSWMEQRFYNASQAQGEKRFSNGLSYLASCLSPMQGEETWAMQPVSVEARSLRSPDIHLEGPQPLFDTRGARPGQAAD